MDSKLCRILLILGLTSLLMIGLGCKSDDEGDPPPAAPTLNSPANAALHVAVNPTPFTWTASSGATGYRLEVATETGFTNKVVDQDVGSVTTYSVNGLNYNTTYYWRVQARAADGQTAYSGSNSFTTVEALIGQWNAANPQPLGFVEFRYFFNTNNSYRNFWRDGVSDYDELGTWQKLQPDSIRFTPTTLNGQTPPYGVYTMKYTLSNNNNDLTFNVPVGGNSINVLMQRVP